ncbi:bis(5'-nucleosyl)-tetraphosphatase (symmetrical) YqeK [Fervidobacterium thailandense]|uniref:Phosphohydrolase n=1 Tax=Fervidobacterium thailandense TaxID=1008305 RepID=A0A1E3G4Q1_9BACT|nr:bis(5'-nucleosyl)-tetraphosphatase (symmetrical) YqeK [Fervidobacterium thailandense]ODN31162.1 phosphohydrolase [Fervidobacterium thailandense]
MPKSSTRKNIIPELEELVRRLVLPERFNHIRGVLEFSLALSKVHSLDPIRLQVMALAHDLFRDLPADKLIRMARAYSLRVPELYRKHPILLHGPLASTFLTRRFKIRDREILLGVKYHTSGHPKLGPYGKVLVISDSVEFGRDYESVEELRRLAFTSLELAYSEVIRNKIIYAVKNDLLLLPETLKTWNSMMEVGRYENEAVEYE